MRFQGRVVIVTGEGLDPTDAIRGCFWPEHLFQAGYPTLIDTDMRAAAHVVEVVPRIRLLHLKPEACFPKEC